MADVIITLKVMPESPETDLAALEEKAKEVIAKHNGEVGKTEIEPIAFGLKAIILTYVINEDFGGTDPVEEDCAALEGCASVEITGCTRALG
jgi:elongation factor 1-beta